MKKERRGGARPGTGPKKKTRVYSEAVKTRLMSLLRKDARENEGEDWLADLVKMQRNEKVQDAVRLGCKKLIADILVVKESHKTVEEHKFPAPILLPVQDDDPKSQEVDVSVH